MTAFRMAMMPADNLVLIRVELFLYRIVQNQRPVLVFRFSNAGLRIPPQFPRPLFRLGQSSRHFVVAELPVQQPGQACGGRVSILARENSA